MTTKNKPLNIFISYNFNNEAFVPRVTYHLNCQPDINAYCYSAQRRAVALHQGGTRDSVAFGN